MRLLMVLIVLAGCGADDPPEVPSGVVTGAATISTGDDPL